jgi:O-antigen/teichoic acid export membrane protein
MTIYASGLVSSVYLHLDMVVVALLAGDAATGLYSVGVKVPRILVAVLTSLVMVLLPRLSKHVQSQDWDSYKRVAGESFHLVCALSFPLATGAFMLAPQIVGILAGTQFTVAADTLRIASVMIPIVAMNGFLGQQVFLANGEERKLLLATVVSATVFVALASVLTPAFGPNGTATSVVAAEGSALLTLLISSKRSYTTFLSFDRRIVVYMAASAIMGCAVYGVARCIPGLVTGATTATAAGCVAYGALLALARDPLVSEFGALLRRDTSRGG